MKLLTTVSLIFLSAFAVNAQMTVLSEDFSTGIGTFSAVDVTDGTDVWTVTTGYMEMNGFGGSDDEDWLISPSVNMDTQEDEYLMFDYNDAFGGNMIELYYSTDYNGGGNVSDVQSATWTQITLDLVDINASSCFSALFHPHRALDISGIVGTNVYFGFKYTGTSGASRQYRIDNFHIEAEYYGGVHAFINGGGSCEALMDTLHNNVKTQTVIEYTSSNYDIWDALMVTDRRLNDAGTAEIVWDMFTDIPSGTGEFEFDHCTHRDGGTCPSGEGLCYNREHSFPRSWWGGTTSYPSDTINFDLHHLTPSDRMMNIYKLNYPPGIVQSASNTGSNGFKVGTNAAYPCSSQNYFEPIDEYKGDYARMYLFIGMRYKTQLPGWFGSNASGDCALSGVSYPPYAPWLMDVLLEWHANDPVSQKEIDRNNAIYALQGNRNPFIDNPDWVGFIWGDHLGNTCSDLFCVTTSSTQTEAACNSYTWSLTGQTYSSTGLYYDTLVNSVGCDSIVTLDLTVTTAATPVVTVTDFCGYSTLSTSGSNLLWSTGETTSSINVTSSGSYTVTQTNGGCISSAGSGVAAPMTVPSITLGTETNPDGCGASTGSIVVNGSGTGVVSWAGGATGNSGTVSLPYTVNGLAAGSYSIDFNDGCPSNTIIGALSDPNAPTPPLVEVQDSCGYSLLIATGSGLLWSTGETTDTITVSSNGTYFVGQTVNGCTSSDAMIAANPLQPTSSATTQTVCDSYQWTDGNTYSATGSYSQTLINAVGCDSLATLDLTILQSTTSTVTDTGIDSLVINGETFTQTGTYTQVLQNTAGCDSTITLNLTITSSAGLSDLSANEIMIVPNPSQKTITVISDNGMQIESIQVLSPMGTIVKQLDPGVAQYNIQDLSPGVYYLTMKIGDSHVVKSFVKMN